MLFFLALDAVQHHTQTTAWVNIIMTVFVIIVLACITLMLNSDAEKLVLKPLEHIIATIQAVARDPMGAVLAKPDGSTQPRVYPYALPSHVPVPTSPPVACPSLCHTRANCLLLCMCLYFPAAIVLLSVSCTDVLPPSLTHARSLDAAVASCSVCMS